MMTTSIESKLQGLKDQEAAQETVENQKQADSRRKLIKGWVSLGAPIKIQRSSGEMVKATINNDVEAMSDPDDPSEYLVKVFFTEERAGKIKKLEKWVRTKDLVTWQEAEAEKAMEGYLEDLKRQDPWLKPITQKPDEYHPAYSVTESPNPPSVEDIEEKAENFLEKYHTFLLIDKGLMKLDLSKHSGMEPEEASDYNKWRTGLTDIEASKELRDERYPGWRDQDFDTLIKRIEPEMKALEARTQQLVIKNKGIEAAGLPATMNDKQLEKIQAVLKKMSAGA